MIENCKLILTFIIKYDKIIFAVSYGGVAQLARAIGSYPVGHLFESDRRYQKPRKFVFVRFFCCSENYFQNFLWNFPGVTEQRNFLGNITESDVRKKEKRISIGFLLHFFYFLYNINTNVELW